MSEIRAASGNHGARVSPEDLVAWWPLSGVSVAEELLAFPTRTVLRVRSDQGSFVVKVAGSDPSRDNARAVLQYLEERDFPYSPRLLRTRVGEGSVLTEDMTVIVMEYLPEPALDRAGHDRTSAWADLGTAVSCLNAQTDCETSFSIPITAALDELARRVRGQSFEMPFLRLLDRLRPLGEKEPDALIHGEANPANARRRSDGRLVLVDWDQAGMAPAALDYGYPLIVGFVSERDRSVDREAARAFYAAYRDQGGAVSGDLAFEAGLFHAMRYMWWGDTGARWTRIVWALDHEDELRALAAE